MRCFLPIALALPLALMACAQSPTPPKEGEICGLSQQDFDKQVAASILRQSKVVIDAQKAYQAEAPARARAAVLANQDALTASPREMIAGNPDGAVTIIEFFDNRCPFCKRESPVLAKIAAANPDVRIIYKEFPILGPVSVFASKAALASVRQGKYLAFHEALMADPTEENLITEQTILDVARRAGLDLARLKADMADPDIERQIGANLALANTLEIHSTPSLIVGGQLLMGALPEPALQDIVKKQRDALKAQSASAN